MRHLLAICATLALTTLVAAADYPKVELKTDQLQMTVYLPDAEKGFYRGTRFDWSGVIGDVRFKEWKLFGPWKDKHDPTHNDDIVGPVDEFGMQTPLGYDGAKVGETFLKIGVGELEKPKEEKYNFFRKYKIVRPGTWTVKATDREAVFTQEMATKAGYGYRYVKRVRLPDPPERFPAFVIEHELKNTGTKPISTDVYNHNFFNVAGSPVGPDYEFRFPFDVKADARERFGELVAITGGTLRFNGPLDKGSVYAVLTGYGDAARDGRFDLIHKSGLGVTVTGDRPLSRLAFWGVGSTICPEPFVAVKLAPGESMKWSWTYELFDWRK
jgi:hypothetical protein